VNTGGAALRRPDLAARLRPALPALVDAGFVLVAGFLALTAFGAAFGGQRFLLAGGGGLVVSCAVAFAGTRFAQPVLLVLAEEVVAYFLVGGALAVPSASAAGFLPTPAAVSALATTAVTGWRGLLTVSPVVGDTANLLVVPFLCGMVTGAAATLLARRARLWMPALAPPVALLAAGIVFGTDVPPSTVLTGGALGAVLLGYGAYRARGERQVGIGTASRLRPVIGGGLLAACAAGGVVLAPSVPLASAHARWVLRDHVTPPLDVQVYPSPLAAYRFFRWGTDDLHTALFTVSGLPAGRTLLRFATMDAYDGRAFEVAGGSTGSSASGNFASVGSPVSGAACPQQAPCNGTLQLTFDVRGYGGLPGSGSVFMPDAGIVRSVSFAGPRAPSLRGSFRYNVATDSAIVPAGLESGDTYTITASVPQPTAAEASSDPVANVVLPQPQDVPPIVATKAATITAGVATAFGRAERLAQWFEKEGAYSDGESSQPPSLPGHGGARLAQFLGQYQPVGDAEQYAAAMALMADSLGLPARVVLGAPVSTTTAGGSATVYGSDVTAWVEVDFAGVGWYPFFPTPGPDNHLVKPPHQPPVPSSSQPHQYLPPVAPNTAANAAGTNANSTGSATPHHLAHVTRAAGGSAVLAVAIGAGGGLLVIVAPLVAVLALKARRRARRRRRSDPSAQIAGGWAEVLDRARDYGRPLPRAATRNEQAQVIGGSSAGVAAAADRAVFGPGQPAPADVEAFWRMVDGIVDELGSGLPAWRRARAQVSTASLRTGAGS
jgi:hypothetical protein